METHTQTANQNKSSTKKTKGATSKVKASANKRKNALFANDAKIKLEGSKNPHRPKSKDFKKYVKLSEMRADARTVAKAVEAGVDRGYLSYGVKREILTIS